MKQESATELERLYVGPPGRQIHVLQAGPIDPRPPLCCLHALAYSGRTFSPFLRAMSTRRRVLAFDIPGYGGSDRPAEPLGIDDYAERIGEALDALGLQQVDLFGFHSGALIAAELARVRAAQIRRLVLIGIPYVSGDEHAYWRARLALPTMLTEELAQFEERWSYFVTGRSKSVSLMRGFENFVDELLAYPYGWWGHEAVFTFDVGECLRRVGQPALVLNPDNHLSEPSRRAAAELVGGRLVELPHLDHGIFDAAAEELAQRMAAFLDEK